jgi:hypothetical protein
MFPSLTRRKLVCVNLNWRGLREEVELPPGDASGTVCPDVGSPCFAVTLKACSVHVTDLGSTCLLIPSVASSVMLTQRHKTT